MALRNSQDTRSIFSTSQYTVEMAAALPEATAMQQAGRTYHAQAFKNKAHNLGEPYVHTFGCLAMTLTKRDIPEEPKEMMKHVKTQVANKTTGSRWILRHTSECRVREIRQKAGDDKKVLMYIMHWPQGVKVVETILAILETLRCTWKHGEATPSDLERQAQAQLKSLQKE